MAVFAFVPTLPRISIAQADDAFWFQFGPLFHFFRGDLRLVVAASTDRARRPRIVVAEYERELRTLLASGLQRRGMDVATCEHGLQLAEAVERAFGEKGVGDIDLVITNMCMPGVTSISILAGVAAFGRSCPFILITSFGDEQTHAEARRLRAAAVFDKPLDVERVLDCACTLLDRPR